MRPPPGRPLVRRGLAMVLCMGFGLWLAPGTVAAASLSFGTPSARSTFGTGIVFNQAFVGGSFKQADVVIDFPGDPVPSVAAIASPGSSTLTYTLDASAGGLTPFEPLTAHFQVIFADGTIQPGPDVHVTYADDRYAWRSVSGKLVTIHWIDGTSAFGQQMLNYGDAGFAKSAAFLGTTETRPVDFYIYPSQAAFQAGLSAPETIGGQAEPEYRTCFALVTPGDLAYASTVIPHELTHVVFADILNGPYHSPPDWLNEGLAVYLSEGYGSDNRQLVAQAVRGGTLLPLPSLAGYFALDAAHIYLSYAEAVSATDFMVRKYGQSAIQKLLKTYAEGATDDEAFKAVLGVDTVAFDKAWMADNGATAPTEYGPQPAPTGPVPPGWTGSSATAPPLEPTASTATGSSPPGGQGSNLPNGSGSSVFVLAGLIAFGGLILLGAGILLYVESQPRRTHPDGPPPS